MIKDVDLKLKYVDGESYVRQPPVFSSDSQFVFVASKHRLYSYTRKTGKRFVEFKGIENDIVNFGVYNTDETECLIVCTVDGKITCWKASNGLKIKQTKLLVGQVKFFHVFENSGKNYAFLSWVNIKNGLLASGVLNLTNFNLKELSISYKNGRSCKLSIGTYKSNETNRTFVAYISGRKMFINPLYVEKQEKEIKPVKIKIANRKFTVIATHPTEAAILTGDNTGRVVLWQNIFGKFTQCVFHWHTLPVNTVCFSASGSNFFSGADECVLVKWMFDDTTQRRFLPRLSNCIQHLAVSTENLYVAIATADNAVHIVDMQFNEVSIVQELILGDDFPAGMHLDPKTRALVLNGTTGHLQFYSPQNKQLLYNLDVVGMNRITNERNTEMANTQITSVALSKTGLWMATLEERSDDDDLFESRLKFWSFNETKQNFQLNTNVEYAHDGHVINLKFQPTNKTTDLQLVTLGVDGFFKVWQLVDVTSVYKKGFSWRCASSGFYRDLKPTAMAFSDDGSLLAVGFENILTTWLPETVALKCSLKHALYSETIAHLAFGTNTQCHLVVVAGRKRLCVWNLLTLAMIWTVPLHVTHLVTEPSTIHMGVITDNNKLFIFEPANETPLHIHEDLVKGTTTINAAILVPTGRVYKHRKQQNLFDKSQLYIIDSDKELHCFDNSSGYDDAMLEPMHFLLNESETQSALSNLTPALKPRGVKPTQVVHNFTQKLAKSKLDDLLDGSIHTMVPMRMIAHAIINSMIHQKSKVNTERDEDDRVISLSTKIDQPMEVDSLAEDLSKIVLEPVTWIDILT